MRRTWVTAALCGVAVLASVTGASGGPVIVTNLAYAVVGEAPVRMDVHLPDSTNGAPWPWLIRFSSGVEKRDGAGKALLENGYALVYASYNATNQTRVYPPYPQLPTLAHRAVRFVRSHAGEYGLDPVRCGVWGWSRGGYSAAILAATGWTDRYHDGSSSNVSSRVAACIAIAGSFYYVAGDQGGQDLRTWSGGDESAADPETELLRRVSTWVTPLMPPTLLLRGANDGDPLDAQRLHGILQQFKIPTDLYIKPGAGHGVSGPDINARILAWADTYIRGATPEYLDRQPSYESMAIRLAEANQFNAARQVLGESRWTADRTAEAQNRMEGMEGVYLAGRIRGMQVAQTSRVAYTQDLERLAELVAKHADLRPDLDVLVEEDARRQESIRLAVMAMEARIASGSPVGAWPSDVIVPVWAAEHGMDAFGPWVTLGVPSGGPSVTQRLRWCPAGEAALGVEPGGWGFVAPERPRRRVVIARGFWLGDTEVTQALFEGVMGYNPSHFKNNPTNPVEKVNLERAEEFLARLREKVPNVPVRLPRVDEWVWACRAGGAHVGTFAGTDDLDPMGWYAGNSGGTTHPVKSKLPNAWGFYDMQGNVWEWCGDLPEEKPAHYRFYVGGSFCSSPARCRPDTIGFHNQSNTTWYHGFRLAVDAP
jgi:formylglycine-generating enzyme required for sulfatase activity/acetyl esterase/lipase